MGLLNLLPNSKFGYGGKKPIFDIIPAPPASFHNSYSIDGHPNVLVRNTSANFVVPQPSKLDERDISNTNKYRSSGNTKYSDNLPK